MLQSMSCWIFRLLFLTSWRALSTSRLYLASVSSRKRFRLLLNKLRCVNSSSRLSAMTVRVLSSHDRELERMPNHARRSRRRCDCCPR